MMDTMTFAIFIEDNLILRIRSGAQMSSDPLSLQPCQVSNSVAQGHALIPWSRMTASLLKWIQQPILTMIARAMTVGES